MPKSYNTILAYYIDGTGHEPKPDWAGFLYLFCAVGLWECVKPFLHLHGRARRPGELPQRGSRGARPGPALFRWGNRSGVARS